MGPPARRLRAPRPFLAATSTLYLAARRRDFIGLAREQGPYLDHHPIIDNAGEHGWLLGSQARRQAVG